MPVACGETDQHRAVTQSDRVLPTHKTGVTRMGIGLVDTGADKHSPTFGRRRRGFAPGNDIDDNFLGDGWCRRANDNACPEQQCEKEAGFVSVRRICSTAVGFPFEC